MRKKCLWLMICLTLSVVGSCDNQSPNARLIGDMEVSLIANTADGSPFLDVWTIQKDGSNKYNHICGAAFGFKVKIGDDVVTPSGIKIKCEVLEHFDPLYSDDRGDLWDKSTLASEDFGYIRTIPDGTFDDDVATARTNAGGEVIFFVGLGSRDTGFGGGYDTRYEWPSGNNTINTVVNLKIVMPKKSGNLEQLVSVQFIRAQYADFWSVYSVSFSSLGEWTSPLRTFSISEVNEVNKMLFQPVIYPKKERPTIDSNEPDRLISSSRNMNFPTSGEDWIFLGTEGGVCGNLLGWKQLAYCPLSCSWVWREPCDIYPSWLDANGADRTIEFFTDSEPLTYNYSLLLTYGSEYLPKYQPYDFPGYWDGSTMEIRSVDSNGIVLSIWPVKTWVSNWGRSFVGGTWDKLNCTTDFIVPIINKTEGYYFDSEGNKYLAIFCPEGAHLEAWPNTRLGDFNFDGAVDFCDYSLLIQNMGSYQNTFYDVMYDSNLDGYVDRADVIEFVTCWLNERYIPGDWNRNYVVNFVDFALSKETKTICENWLRGIR